MSRAGSSVLLAPLVQGFFCDRLLVQRGASRQTVASYRDAFRLLLRYASERLHTTPAELALVDLDAPLVLGFLGHLEVDRGNSVRTRNARLTAIRSFMRYCSYERPEAASTIQRVLAIPSKKFDRPLLGFLSQDEMEAVIAAPDSSTWSGRRDRAMFRTLYNTGARVSEIVAIELGDLETGRPAQLRLRGKGRKERLLPLWRSTADALTDWMPELPSEARTLFPNRRGWSMSRSGVERRLRSAVLHAADSHPALRSRRISPHTIRHTTAMHMLQSGIDITVIALWLGHESPTTTHQYIEADLAMKERALAKLDEPLDAGPRYRPTDAILDFLDGL